jgi:hypothetical protein
MNKYDLYPSDWGTKPPVDKTGLFGHELFTKEDFLDDGWLETLVDSLKEDSPTYHLRFSALQTLLRDYRRLRALVLADLHHE